MGRVIAAIVGVVAVVAIVLVIVNPFAESEEEKALNAVCDSRAAIQQEVEKLKALTPATFTADEVQESIQTISSQLSTIQDNVPTLADDVGAQVNQANQQFRTELAQLGSEVVRSISAKDAAEQLQSSFAELASTYQQAYSSLKCPS